jgi:hypothetical protein
MAGVAAGWHDASSLWPGEGLTLAGDLRSPGRTHGFVHARRCSHEREGVRTRVGARRATVESWELVGPARVAMAGGAPHWLAHEQARKLDGDWVFAPPGRKAYPDGDTSAHGEWDASEWLGVVNWQKGRPCLAWHTRAHERARAWVHGHAGVCQGARGAHRCQDRDGRMEQRQ